MHLHKDDQPLWDNLQMQCQMFGVPYTPVPPPDRWLGDDEELACGCGVALHTPGHTPGSMSFWFADAKLLIAGDTLFRRGIGRTDLWGGDQRAIVRSIKERLYRLDEEAVVVTGHGGYSSWRRNARKSFRAGVSFTELFRLASVQGWHRAIHDLLHFRISVGACPCSPCVV